MTSPAARQKDKQDPAKGKKAAAAGPELYDLANDPFETHDLASAQPEIVTRLKQEAAHLEAEIQANKRPPGRSSVVN